MQVIRVLLGLLIAGFVGVGFLLARIFGMSGIG